jgi:hypothetical protein
MSRTIKATRPNWRAVSFLLAGVVIALFIVANAHLIYVAFASQPDCLPHSKAGENHGASFSAAKSSC